MGRALFCVTPRYQPHGRRQYRRDEDISAVGEAAHAVIRKAKDAGVYVFGGGINEDVAPLMVAADGTVTNGTYPQTKEFDGGFCVLELPSREAAVHWAAKIAKACRC
jgi:hypothetical protein